MAGRSLDELAARGSDLRREVETHLVATLEAAAGDGERTVGRRGRAKRATSAPDASERPAPRHHRSSAGQVARARRTTEGTVASGSAAIIYSDGASRGNPGPAAIGFRILAPDGSELWSEGRRIGRATNNVAEYRGVLAALEKGQELGLVELEIRLDSELVVRQLQGAYRVKEPHLAELKARVDGLLAGFRTVRIRHVRREENRETDALANEALDGSAG